MQDENVARMDEVLGRLGLEQKYHGGSDEENYLLFRKDLDSQSPRRKTNIQMPTKDELDRIHRVCPPQVASRKA